MSAATFSVRESAMREAALILSSKGAVLGRRAESLCSAVKAMSDPTARTPIHTLAMWIVCYMLLLGRVLRRGASILDLGLASQSRHKLGSSCSARAWRGGGAAKAFRSSSTALEAACDKWLS